MLKPSEAGFRRLLPLLRPHLRQLVVGLICMLVYVSSFLLLLNLAGDLFPALGSRDLGRVLSLIGQGVLIFAVQKLAQFGQDSLLAGPALQVSKTLRSDLFSKLQTVELGALEKLFAGDLTYRLTEDADRVSEVLYKSVHDTLPSVLQLFAVRVTCSGSTGSSRHRSCCSHPDHLADQHVRRTGDDRHRTQSKEGE